MKRTLFIALGILGIFPLIGSAVESELCHYNEFRGELKGQYEAHDVKNSRAWVPLRLKLCVNNKGTYGIITHKAVALGELANPPLKTPKYKDLAKEDRQMILLISNRENDLEAIKALENPLVEAVMVAGSSKTQITVFRKELNRIFSNTLFEKKAL